MADSPPVLLQERANRVAVLTLNRPQVLNAFDEDLVQGLTQALRDAERDPEVGAGAERSARAGEDDRPHLGVTRCRLESRAQGMSRLWI